MAKHSIAFGAQRLTVNEAITKLQGAMPQTDLVPGGNYLLMQMSADSTHNDIVTVRRGLPRDKLPEIAESPSSYNGVSIKILSDVMGLVLGIDVLPENRTRVSLVFMDDILQDRGSPWTVRVMSAFQNALEAPASLLCDERDSGEVARRVTNGQELSDIILARVRGEDSLPSPLLALVKAELCSSDIHELAKARGIRTGLTTKMYILFSTVDA